MTAYYNEIDGEAADLMRWLIARGVIADGIVDTRSIAEVQPEDLREFTQCHFFAGLGGWSYAARLAGWGDDRPLWTGSCPCQPFSAAGKRRGTADERHLWPHLLRLVRSGAEQARRRRERFVCVGEQVAGAAGDAWLDGVCADVEGGGLAFRAVEVPACAVNAPHQRQRNYWLSLAEPDSGGEEGRSLRRSREGAGSDRVGAYDQSGGSDSRPSVLDNADGDGREQGRGEFPGLEGGALPVGANGADRQSVMADADGGAISDGGSGTTAGASGEVGGEAWEQRLRVDTSERDERRGLALGDADADGQLQPLGSLGEGGRWTWDAIARNSGLGREFYADADWILCHDGKARRVADAGASLLAHGFPNRVLGWRVFGNAIHAVLASEILASLLDVLPEARHG